MSYIVEKLPNHNIKFGGGDVAEKMDVLLYNGDFFAGLALSEGPEGAAVTVDLVLSNTQGDVECDAEAVEDFLDSCQQVCITNPNVHRTAESAWTNAAEMLTLLAAECAMQAKMAKKQEKLVQKTKTTKAKKS
jgi:hypothetical protein